MKTIEEAFPAWSKSGLDALTSGCSYRVYLQKVEGWPDPGSPAAVLGTAYHYALESHERDRILQVRDGVNVQETSPGLLYDRARVVLDTQARALPERLWAVHDTSLDELQEKLATAIEHWWSAPIPGGQPGAGMSLRDRLLQWRPVAVEPYFNVSFGDSDRPLHGFIDWLGWDEDAAQWVVVDQKSASSFRSWPHGGGGHELEAAAYTFGSIIGSNLPVFGSVRQEWHVARTDAGSNSRHQPVRVIQTEPGDAEWYWLQDTMNLADQIVDEGLWEKNPDWFLCSETWCPMHVGAGGPCDPAA